jgi:hypothetical protein
MVLKEYVVFKNRENSGSIEKKIMQQFNKLLEGPQ